MPGGESKPSMSLERNSLFQLDLECEREMVISEAGDVIRK